MTGITREKASQVAASYLGGESLYLGTYYKTYAATDSQGRMWKFCLVIGSMGTSCGSGKNSRIPPI